MFILLGNAKGMEEPKVSKRSHNFCLKWLNLFTAFMAPEVLSYGGEHEYTNRVDIFSFGMLIYELIMLKPPYDGQERMKEHILECRRPHVTEKVC